ncbi:putative reverse transcriptase domain-containing protein [Tanacetum coccineum]
MLKVRLLSVTDLKNRRLSQYSPVRGNFVPKFRSSVLRLSAREQLRILAFHHVFSVPMVHESLRLPGISSSLKRETCCECLSVDAGNGRIGGRGGQVGGQGSEVNDGVDRVPDFSTIIAQQNQNGDAINNNIRGDVRNVIADNNRRGCTYKEFLACNSKEYDGKGGAIVYTRWIEKIESVQDMSGCKAAVGMSWEDFKTLTREEFCPSNEMKKLELSCGITPWSRLAMLCTLIGFMSWLGMVAATEPKTIQKAIQISGTLTDEALRNRSIKRTLRREEMGENLARIGIVVPRNVKAVNARNPATACGAYYKCRSIDHYKLACPRLNRAQGIKPRDLRFSFEIEIASRQLVDIYKVIKGCKLEIDGHVFDINLIPFGSGSFDVIIGIDWLFDHKAKIICHEKVVRIPLLDGKALRVLVEKLKEKVRHSMSAKAKEQKQEEIVVVRDFLEVFADDLLGSLEDIPSSNITKIEYLYTSRTQYVRN